MTWTTLTADEKHAAVRQAIQIEGLTYKEAAERLGASRVAIAGVVERSTRREGGRIESTRKAPKPAPKKSRGGEAATRQRLVQLARARRGIANKFVAAAVPVDTQDFTPPRPDAWEALPGSNPKRIEDYHRGCRWPVGEAPVLFCSEPTGPEHVYCPTHRAMGIKPIAPKAQRRNDLPRRIQIPPPNVFD